LLDYVPVFEHGHRAELVDDDLFPVESIAALLEQRRPRELSLMLTAMASMRGRISKRMTDARTMSLARLIKPLIP